jgi:hypothetical protein
MANEEHLTRLQQGVEVWNEWREAKHDIQPDLTEADLTEADLTGANLSGADLSGADLSGATLVNTNLSEAKLHEVSGMILDSTFIRNARFSPRATDPWSILRRSYTGPKLFFHILLFVAFVVP